MVPSEASGPLRQQLPLLASKAVNGDAFVLAMLGRDCADGLASQSLRSQCHATIVMEHDRDWSPVSEAILSLCFAKFGASDLDAVRTALGPGAVHCVHLEANPGDWHRLARWLGQSSGTKLTPHELGDLRIELDADPASVAFYVADAVGSLMRDRLDGADVRGVAWHARIPLPFDPQLQTELREVLRTACRWPDDVVEAGGVVANVGAMFSIVLMVRTEQQLAPDPNTGWAATAG